MTPKTWIERGDELRVELDELETTLRHCLFEFYRWGHHVSQQAKASDEPEVIVREIRVMRAKLNLQIGNDALRIARWYRDSLAALRSHGRCHDWPDEPWRVA